MSTPTLNAEIPEIQSSDSQEAVTSCSKEQVNSENSSENEGTVEEKTRKRKRKRKSFADSHPLQPPCGCKRKCIDKVSHKKIEIIHKQYCAMNKKLQKEFLFQRVQSFPKKRSRIRGSPKKKRNNTIINSLKVNGKNIAVCSKFFLGTLASKRITLFQHYLTSKLQ